MEYAKFTARWMLGIYVAGVNKYPKGSLIVWGVIVAFALVI